MKRKLNIKKHKKNKKRKITDYFKSKSGKALNIESDQIYVGRIDRYNSNVEAKKRGYTNIKIHSSLKGWGGLSPFHLKTKEGYNFENYWQFSKFYERVRKVRLAKSRFHPDKIIWEWPSEIHSNKDGTPNKNYWNWRQKGFENSYAVRYPNGYNGKNDVKCSIVRDKDGKIEYLDYVEARKKIYCCGYYSSVKIHPLFKALQEKLLNGEKLLILDVDGPDYHNSPGYKLVKKGSLGMDDVGTIKINEKNIKDLLNNTNRPFGHGYVLTSCLINPDWLL